MVETENSKSETEAPLVTLALFAYNQEGYIREAIEAAFSQTYEPLEIILSDDCSSDRTFEIMAEMANDYNGAHKVKVNRNDINMGIGVHVSKVVGMADGQYVAFAAGDDISRPDRVENALRYLKPLNDQAGCEIYSLLSALTLIDEDGDEFGEVSAPRGAGKDPMPDANIFDINDLVSGRLSTAGPARVIPKEIHTIFGDIRDDCFTEDIVYLFRSILAGKVVFLNFSTVLYRKHDNNVSDFRSLYSRNFDGVERQLRKDLKTALEEGMLSESDGEIAERWILDNVSLRNFYRMKVSGQRPELSDMVSIISSPSFSFRRKFGLVREFLGVR